MNNWISVKDFMPPKGKRVLTYQPDAKRIDISILKYYDNEVYAEADCGDHYPIEHWHLLPQIPDNILFY